MSLPNLHGFATSVHIHFNVSFQSEIEWLLSNVGMYHKDCNCYKKTRELAN